MCVCVPTYNEVENIRPFVTALLGVFDSCRLDGTVLVLDDGSPDGTGRVADELAAEDQRVQVVHRSGKQGLGRAYRAGFTWALGRGYDLIAQMDCDFSHDPANLGSLVAAAGGADVVLGSRYVDGGVVEAWPLSRRLISRAGSLYARLLLGLPIRDLTGGFKCFRREVLERIEHEQAQASGYGFQIELTHRAALAGFRIAEVPIVFRDRTMGESKMSLGIAREAAALVLKLRMATITSGDFQAALQRARSFATRVAGLALVLLLGLYAYEHPFGIGQTLLVVVFGLLTLVGASTVSFMLYAWRDADSLAKTEFASPSFEPALSFSLIVPARHEQQVLGATMAQLARLDHPSFEILVVIGHDDPETHRIAVDAAGDDPRFRIVVDSNDEKNKPKALNVALPECRGEIVGVFDAEDVVATGLLRAVDQTFQATGAQVVQGAAQLVNYRSSWFSARNVLEYYFWFRSRLHYQARAGFIPLGGNTVFVRRSWLDAAGGWDENCLAEDCDLGARLSARRARTVVAYTPALATREETPETIAALVKQRTRWNQGFLQVLRKGDWRVLPLRARLLAAYTLAFPFLQAASALVFPFTLLLMYALGFPIELAVVSFLPLVPLFVILAVELAGLHTLGSEFGFDVRARDYLRLLLGVVPYQLLLCFAALRAVWRELQGTRDWEKTAHAGAHL